MILPPLPPPGRAALLLDIDGTLLDFAATPAAVVVPPDLAPTLRRLRERLGGALGLISGRPVAEVDALFPEIAQAVAGEHGAVLRPAPGAALLRPDLPALPATWLAAATRLAAAHPGVLLERKSRGVVLHYRGAPAAGPALGAGLAALVGGSASFSVQPAQMAWELRPRGADKGTALVALMRLPPFAGRLPVFLGDDTTDRDAIAAAQALGGVGIFVPDTFAAPASVRRWLHDLATHGWT